LLILYYILSFEENLLASTKQLGKTISRKPKSYSAALMDQIPIKYLVTQAQGLQQELGGLHSALLRLLATNYPHLCLVEDWVCEEEVTGTLPLLRRMMLPSNTCRYTQSQLHQESLLRNNRGPVPGKSKQGSLLPTTRGSVEDTEPEGGLLSDLREVQCLIWPGHVDRISHHCVLWFVVLNHAKRFSFFMPTLPCLVAFCQAFPPLYDDVAALLVQVGQSLREKPLEAAAPCGGSSKLTLPQKTAEELGGADPDVQLCYCIEATFMDIISSTLHGL
ncbi:hypothetical protein XENOCAPTIV_000758, partial [Xenoophorus captivus]